MVSGSRARWSGAANAQRGPHARCKRGVELGAHVGDEEHNVRGLTERRGDPAIAVRFALGAGRRVEVAGQKWREIARGGVGEKTALRRDAARGKDRDRLAGGVPTLERRAHVRIEFPLIAKSASAIS